MKKLNSFVYFVVPGGPVFAVPASSIADYCKDKQICLNCKHFHQLEDWVDAPEGVYMPRGECLRRAPTTDGFPRLHGGKHCGEFTPQE
ncbi:MAG: hypothetical protein WC092_06660 [Anaerovoracaceae bacterium]